MITIDARWLSVSGMGTYLRNVIPGILSTFPERHFTLIGNREQIGKLAIPDYIKMDVIEAHSKMYSIAEQFEMAKCIPKKTRLFFSPHYNIPLAYTGKMLVTVYDLYHLAMPHLVGGLHKTLYARYMFNAVRRRANAIITISHFTKNELIRFTSEGPQSIYPIHLGVDESWFKQEPTAKPIGKPYILYVGNIKPHKNLTALVHAYGNLVDVIDHDLVLVGKKEGFITGDKASMIEAEKLQGRVRFTGWVSDAELKAYMSNADALVFPSLYEGFGLPPLEAMASGCPVISSNVASLPEICGDAAVYFEPGDHENISDAILRTLKDAFLMDNLRIRGIVQARKFRWDRCVAETCLVLDKSFHSSNQYLRE